MVRGPTDVISPHSYITRKRAGPLDNGITDDPEHAPGSLPDDEPIAESRAVLQRQWREAQERELLALVQKNFKSAKQARRFMLRWRQDIDGEVDGELNFRVKADQLFARES